ncbi:hypothetical protein [Actinophytocola glycyrrhizae]|uniref:Uncharacterized protein n=1 Tax=Actinophytocola glycyrrhizae TaxID=2044873 RepID=A0ABV9SFM9_9PSEU
MTDFPKRVPGASLKKLAAPPDDGWFGQGIEWPAEDQDLIKIERTRKVMGQYLDDSDLSSGAETMAMLDRVLDRIKHL